MMNLNQTKLVGLTMELDLKAREHKKLCNRLEKIKHNYIDMNSESLIQLEKLFKENYDEIIRIKEQIKKLKREEEIIEKQELKQYDTTNLFKKNNDICNNKERNTSISIIEDKSNIFRRLIKWIFNRNSNF